MTRQIIHLGDGEYGVYISGGYRGIYGTPLAVRGTEEQCIAFCIGDREVREEVAW